MFLVRMSKFIQFVNPTGSPDPEKFRDPPLSLLICVVRSFRVTGGLTAMLTGGVLLTSCRFANPKMLLIIEVGSIGTFDSAGGSPVNRCTGITCVGSTCGGVSGESLGGVACLVSNGNTCKGVSGVRNVGNGSFLGVVAEIRGLTCSTTMGSGSCSSSEDVSELEVSVSSFSDSGGVGLNRDRSSSVNLVKSNTFAGGCSNTLPV